MIHEWDTFKHIVEKRAIQASSLDIHAELMSLMLEIEERKAQSIEEMEAIMHESASEFAWDFPDGDDNSPY